MNAELSKLDDTLLFSARRYDAVVLSPESYVDWMKAKVPYDDHRTLHGVPVIEGLGKSYLIESGFDGPLIHML